MNQSASSVSPLPDIQLQFKDVGHVLEAKKSERRKARHQELLMQNKVSYYEKQEKQANRNIEQQKKMLEEIMKVRQRQEEDRRQVLSHIMKKQLQNYLNQQEMSRLRMQSEFERRSHEQHMKEANERLSNRNQYIYESIKGKIDRDVSRKKQNEKEEMKAKREHAKEIQRQKSNGKERVRSFRLQQTGQALNTYKEYMHREESLRESIQDNIRSLAAREQELVQRLKKSQMQHERLQATLANAYDVELNQLEALLSQKPRSRAGRSTSSSKGHRKVSPMATVRKEFHPSMSPQAKFMNITLNTFSPRKEANPEEIPPKRRAKSRLSEAIRHIEQQYRS